MSTVDVDSRAALSPRMILLLFVLPSIVTLLAGGLGGYFGIRSLDAKFNHQDTVTSRAEKQGAYVNFLKLSAIAANADDGEAYERGLRQSQALVQIVGSDAINDDAPKLTRAALGEPRALTYAKARSQFIQDARIDINGT